MSAPRVSPGAADQWSLETPRGPIRTPAFLPDATRGTVRAVDADDLRSVGVTALMTSAFHLGRRPGTRRVQRLGGIHRFNGWDGPIVTDSGGFQVYSLIRQSPGNGAIRENGVLFRDQANGKREWFTPERSIRAQLQLGSDVLIALDDCTGHTETRAELEASVTRTIRWFRQARLELDRQVEQRRLTEPFPPLVGVVQGGSDPELRTACAEALVEIGGVFDCSLPTRDARRHCLYVRLPGRELDAEGSFYTMLYILDAKHAGDERPLSEVCDGPCCRRYSRAYLHHLFKVGDSLGERLATLHNLRLYTQLVEDLARRRPATQ